MAVASPAHAAREGLGSTVKQALPEEWKQVMPKLKTHRGAAKRFKKTATGKFVRNSAFKRHLASSKTTKRKRQLGKASVASPADAATLARMLPYK
jgi:large subunit ribosomal protein L35